VVKSGVLLKRSASEQRAKTEKRVVTILDDRITWRRQNSKKVLGELELTTTTVLEINSSVPHCFELKSPGSDLVLQCANEEEFKEWLACVMNKAHFNARALSDAGLVCTGLLSSGGGFGAEGLPQRAATSDSIYQKPRFPSRGASSESIRFPSLDNAQSSIAKADSLDRLSERDSENSDARCSENGHVR
jgi:hypothetical protein